MLKIYPTTAETKLGFDLIRERLERHTRSRLGQARLDNMQPSTRLEWVREELGRVSELQEAFRFDDAVPLDHILDVRDVLRRVAPEGGFVSPEDLLAVRLALSTLRLTRSYFANRTARYPHLGRVAERIAAYPEIEKRIADAVDDEGRIRDSASPELRRLRRLIIQRQADLREIMQAELRKAIGQGFATEDQPTIRNGRMVIPVRSEARRKVEGFVHDVSATGQTVYIEPSGSLDLNNEVRELEAQERREVESILRDVASGLRAHLEGLRENVKVLALFDLLQAKARLSNELGSVAPALNDAGVMDIRKGRNPVLLLRFLRAAEEDGVHREVVSLDLNLGEHYRTLVITGPNAGGKTVAMKTVGLFALMLSYGLPIPVDPLSSGCLFHHLIVDIGDEQSIEEDLSTFSSHVANLKYMIRHSSPEALVLIDEAGTGTDPAEGGALAQAVLEHLTHSGARTIATTHHGTLKVFAHETEGVENGSMQFDQATLSPTYRFLSGVPGSSYAFEIARRIGLDGGLLDRAANLVGRQKTSLEELIASFQARTQALDEQLRLAETEVRRATEEKERYEERSAALRDKTDEIRRQALEEADRVLREANARVERTIRQIREAQAEREATLQAREQLDAFKADLGRKQKELDARRKKIRRPGGPKSAGVPKSLSRPIQAGDQVVLDGGTTPAEVLDIANGEAAIAFGSVRMRVALDRLVRVGGARRQQVTVRQVQGSGQTDISALGVRNTVDLRGRRADEAVQEVEMLIDRALLANLDEVEILHGKGTGALRSAIHEYLARRSEVESFEDASWNQGGSGVTIVRLR